MCLTESKGQPKKKKVKPSKMAARLGGSTESVGSSVSSSVATEQGAISMDNG